MRGMGIAVALLVSMLATNTAYAQMQMTRSQADPADKLFRLVAPDGTVVAADGVTRRFYIQAPNGASAEFTFDEALAAAEPDASKRAQLRAKFEGALANQNLANYTYINSLKPCEPPPGKERCEIEPFAAHGGNLPGMLVMSEEDDEDDEDPETTDLETVSVIARRPLIFTVGGATGRGFWSNPGPYVNPHEDEDEAEEYQQCWSEDFNDFMQAQAEACHDYNIKTAYAATSLAAAGVACIATGAETIGVGCVVAAIIHVVTSLDLMYSEGQCLAVYPGPEAC